MLLFYFMTINGPSAWSMKAEFQPHYWTNNYIPWWTSGVLVDGLRNDYMHTSIESVTQISI